MLHYGATFKIPMSGMIRDMFEQRKLNATSWEPPLKYQWELSVTRWESPLESQC